MRYNNYHKHTHKSNIFSPDTHIKIEDYMKRMKELGHNIYFTTEHGFGGDIFEARKYCDEYGFKCVFALEGYCVVNPSIKDSSNYHIMIIAKTNNARKQMNKINSIANKNGFYYKPRLALKDILSLPEDEVFITTSCIAGIIRDDKAINEIFIPLYNKFKQNLLIEVQPHIHPSQIRHNKKAKKMAHEFNLKLISGNDSHYIYPEDAKDRQMFLEGKNVNYGDEDSFILDYPDYKTLIDRYEKQGVLTKKEVQEAIQNTLLFDECETIDINYKVKMPSIYSDLTIDEKHDKLHKIIYKKFEEIKIKDKIPENKINDYYKAIEEEFNIIKETASVNTADYFLLNERIIDLAINKYGGVLTKTGRGSNVAFYINRLLGFTEIDRLTSEIPLYPTRFMSKSRILETRSMPDCDFNTKSPEPFIKATKELLGEDNCYWMIAYGTMQIGEAFRNVCRSEGLKFSEYNEIAKNIDNYRNDKYWGKLIKKAEKFVDVVVSASPHPCANLLLDKPISEEIGLVRINGELCALINSDEADEWKYLKNDYLVVTVWDIIDEVFKSIGKPIMSIKELRENLDEKVWEIYSKGLTATVNQVDSDWTTELVKKYKPKSIEELAMFTSSIRPFFKPWRESFLNRENYTTGVKQLDELFKPTKHYILFQENLMQFLSWLGIESDKTIGIIKKISKKKMSDKEFKKIEKTLHKNWIKNVGNDDKFDEIWEMIQSCLDYGYNAPHALAMAYDSLYCAYLKSHYPEHYYPIVLNKYADDEERTSKLIKELEYFGYKIKPIKFRYSHAEYTIDKENNIIYKGIESIKYMNYAIAEELYKLRNNKYSNFMELLEDIKQKTSCNSKQLEILIKLDFFNEFGNSKFLIECTKYYNLLANAKQISLEKVVKENLPIDILKRYSRFTGKTFLDINNSALLNEVYEMLKITIIEDFPLKDKIKFQQEYLGYINIKTGKEEDRRKLIILDIKPLVSKKYNNVWAYSLKTMSLGSGKVSQITIGSYNYINMPINKYDIIYAQKLEKRNGYWWCTVYNIIDK